MARRVLAVQLVPDEEFEGLLAELRTEDREARMVALAAAEEVPAADETIDWRAYARGPLLAELRSREFDRAVIAHGRDHYATRPYWKAVLLLRAVGPREVILCEGGTLAGRHGVATGARRALIHILQECGAAVLGLAVLLPLVLGAAVTDLLSRLTGTLGRTQHEAKKR